MLYVFVHDLSVLAAVVRRACVLRLFPFPFARVIL